MYLFLSFLSSSLSLNGADASCASTANRAKGEFNYPTIIIGSPRAISKTLKQLKACLSLGYAPIAVCPVASVCDSDDPNAAQHLISVPFIPANDEEARLKVMALNSHLPQTAKRMKVRTILIADVLTHDSETMRTLSLAVESMGIELALTASVADLSGANLQLHNDPLCRFDSPTCTVFSADSHL